MFSISETDLDQMTAFTRELSPKRPFSRPESLMYHINITITHYSSLVRMKKK